MWEGATWRKAWLCPVGYWSKISATSVVLSTDITSSIRLRLAYILPSRSWSCFFSYCLCTHNLFSQWSAFLWNSSSEARITLSSVFLSGSIYRWVGCGAMRTTVESGFQVCLLLHHNVDVVVVGGYVVGFVGKLYRKTTFSFNCASQDNNRHLNIIVLIVSSALNYLNSLYKHVYYSIVYDSYSPYIW